MYSSRRKYFRYQNKKHYRNNLFAPSFSKAPAPNYYQMKGRIIQQTPANMKNSPSEIITRSKLDEMYQKLIKFKYPIPGNIDLSSYTLYTLTEQIPLFDITNNFRFDNTYFQNITALIPHPQPPNGYHYNFQVLDMILYGFSHSGNTDISRFNFVWQTSLLSSGTINVISKEVDSNITSTYSGNVQCLSYTPNQCFVNRLSITSNGVNAIQSRQNTNDANVTDDGYYPLLSSDSSDETYNSFITYTKTVDSDLLKTYHLRFKILLYISPDSI